MKKESFVAVGLGISAGVGIAILLISNSKPSEGDGKKIITPAVTPRVSIAQKPVFTLTLKKPVHNSSTSNDSIEIEGTTLKDSLIVITSASADRAFINKNGDFKVDFPLALGENIIQITAYNKKESSSKQLSIYNLGDE